MDSQHQKSLVHRDVFLTEKELAARWKVSHHKLSNDRWHKLGCPYVRLGRCVRYKLKDVEEFENRCHIGTGKEGSLA